MNKDEKVVSFDDNDDDGLVILDDNDDDGLVILDDAADDGLVILEDDGLIIDDDEVMVVDSSPAPSTSIEDDPFADPRLEGLEIKPIPLDFSMDDDIEYSFEGELEIEDFHVTQLSQQELDNVFDMANSSGIHIGTEDDPILIASEMGIPLMLESGEVSPQALQIGFNQEGEYVGDKTSQQQYQVALTPRQSALSVYTTLEDEKEKLELVVSSLHEKLTGSGMIMKNAEKRLREHLDAPTYHILTKRTKFSTDRYRKMHSYTELLVSAVEHFHAGALDVDKFLERIFDIWDTENYHEIDKASRMKIGSLVREFLKFGRGVIDQALRQLEESKYESDIEELTCPELVKDFAYTCTCGVDIPMPDGLPTLTFYIDKSRDKNPNVFFMNEPVPCHACNHHLALPVQLAEAIETKFINYVRGLRATYEEARIYRPKLEILNTIIPTDAASLFQFDSSIDVVVDAKSQVLTTHRADVDSYIKVKRYLMSSVEKSEVNKEIVNQFMDYNDPLFSNLVAIAPNLTFSKNLELAANRYLRTLLHYLEGFGLFKITEEQTARELVYKKEGLNREFFDDEYALDWLNKHAVLLTSFKVIYSDPKPVRINIRPEYRQIIFKIIYLHFLADPTLFRPGKALAGWVNNPSLESKTYEYALNYNKGLPSWLWPASSLRDMQPTQDYYDAPAVWSGLQAFAANMLEHMRVDRSQPIELRTIISTAIAMTPQEFYGFDDDFDYENALFKPTHRLEEFKEVFYEYGHLLFQGVFIDPMKLNLAKAVSFLAVPTARLEVGIIIERLFQITTEHRTNVKSLIPYTIIDEVEEKPDEYREEIMLKAILDIAELPAELEDKRMEDESLTITDARNNVDILISDRSFIDKYGEVLPCFLRSSMVE